MFRVPEDLLLQQGVPGGALEEDADSDQGGCILYRQGQAMQKVLDSKYDAPSLWCLIFRVSQKKALGANKPGLLAWMDCRTAMMILKVRFFGTPCICLCKITEG